MTLKSYQITNPVVLLDTTAESLNAATSRAIDLGCAPFDPEKQELTQREDFSPRCGIVRRVHVWDKQNPSRPVTGFAVYEVR